MTVKRTGNVGIVGESLDAAIAFFRELGMNCESHLRDVAPDDLPIFFEHQLDADATRMTAFPSRDRAAFDAHLGDEHPRRPGGDHTDDRR